MLLQLYHLPYSRIFLLQTTPRSEPSALLPVLTTDGPKVADDYVTVFSFYMCGADISDMMNTHDDKRYTMNTCDFEVSTEICIACDS